MNQAMYVYEFGRLCCVSDLFKFVEERNKHYVKKCISLVLKFCALYQVLVKEISAGNIMDTNQSILTFGWRSACTNQVCTEED